MESNDSRRDTFLFLFAAFISILALAAETRSWNVPVLTQILLAGAIIVGILAFWFFIYTWRNKFGDPMDKVPEILETMSKNLTAMNEKLDKLVKDNERDKHKSN